MSDLKVVLARMRDRAAAEPGQWEWTRLGGRHVCWKRLAEPAADRATDLVKLLSRERLSFLAARELVAEMPDEYQLVDQPKRVLDGFEIRFRRRHLCAGCRRPIADGDLLFGDGEHCARCQLLALAGVKSA